MQALSWIVHSTAVACRTSRTRRALAGEGHVEASRVLTAIGSVVRGMAGWGMPGSREASPQAVRSIAWIAAGFGVVSTLLVLVGIVPWAALSASLPIAIAGILIGAIPDPGPLIEGSKLLAWLRQRTRFQGP